MLINSKRLFLQALICGTFIATGSLVMSSDACAQTNGENKKAQINQQLLTPNEAVDAMTDMERARRYYQARESIGNSQKEEETEVVQTTADEEIKLPPRKQKNALLAHIYRVDISQSEVFSPSEIEKFKSLMEGKDVSAEDVNNFVQIINAQYLKKGIMTARAFVAEGKLEGVLKIELMEAHIGKLAIEGNKYNKTWYLRSQISHQDGDIFSLQDLIN